MTPARRSPSTRTLGIQLVVMSVVLAFIARIFQTAIRPMPVIATSRNATTLMILARMEMVANIMGLVVLARARLRIYKSTKTSAAPITHEHMRRYENSNLSRKEHQKEKHRGKKTPRSERETTRVPE